MRTSSVKSGILVACLVMMGLVSCGDDKNEANKRGVGSECSSTQACTEPDQMCLAFKGGYCGVQGCTQDADCPGGSACVLLNSNSYCFLICNDKSECNVNRTAANEANCSSSVTFVETVSGRKACIPPS